MKNKDCSSCGKSRPEDEFYLLKASGRRHAMCKPCVREKQRQREAADPETAKKRKREWAEKHPEYAPAYQKEYHRQRLLKSYGLTNEQFEVLQKKAGGACRICGTKPKRLVIDHDHKSGRVRELLCDQCNHLLGNAYDSVTILEAAVRYLRHWQS